MENFWTELRSYIDLSYALLFAFCSEALLTLIYAGRKVTTKKRNVVVFTTGLTLGLIFLYYKYHVYGTLKMVQYLPNLGISFFGTFVLHRMIFQKLAKKIGS